MECASIFAEKIYNEAYWPELRYMYSKTWSEYSMNYHRHAWTEVMYVLMGYCNVYIANGEHERVIELSGGSFIILDFGIRHRIEAPKKCYMLNAEFCFVPARSGMYTMRNLYNTSRAFRKLIAQRHGIVLGRDSSGELYRALACMLESYFSADARPAMHCIFEAQMALFLMQLGEQYQNGKNALEAPPHIRKALKYIDENFLRRISVSEIAGYLGLHSVYFQRIFHQAMGMTVHQYITRRRIDKAKMMIETCDNLTLTELALHVGYQKRQSLILAFKKSEGITPGEYKRLSRRPDREQFTLEPTAPHHE